MVAFMWDNDIAYGWSSFSCGKTTYSRVLYITFYNTSNILMKSSDLEGGE